jgi:hypothetical protein
MFFHLVSISFSQIGILVLTDYLLEQVVTMALENGYNLERLKLEQSVAGPPVSAGVKAMRQSHYVILLTLEKIRSKG